MPGGAIRGAGRVRSWWTVAVLAVALGVTSLGVLAYLVGNRATDAVRHEARASLSATASLTALFLSEQLGGVEELMGSFARRRLLQRALEQPGRGVRPEAQRHMIELVRSRPGTFNAAGIVDPAGRMLASTVGPQAIGADFSDRDWYQVVSRSRKPYVSKALAGRSPGSPLAIAVATPVQAQSGRLLGIMVVGYTLDDLQAFVRRFARNQGVDVTVTDQAGVVIGLPNATPRSLTSSKADRRVRAALAGRKGTADGDRNAMGKPVLSAFAPVPRLGWTVVAERPSTRAYAEVDRLQTEVILITAPLALLMLTGGTLLARALRSRDVERDRAERLASINKAVLEASREGMTLIDPQGRPLSANPTIQEYGKALGLEPDADRYAELVRVAPATTDPEAFAATIAALRANPDLEVSDEFTLADSGRSFHRYSTPVRDEDGTVIGRLFVLRETTAERQAQSDLQRAREHAEQANSAKTEFLSRMSHELRTPLHAILGFGELLEGEDLPEEQRAKLSQMTRGGRHLLALINEVLDLSRIERGDLSMSVEPVHAGQVVQETLELVGPLAAARSVTIAALAAADFDLYVMADRQRLKQVLLNILSNAIKYNREGGGVKLSCARDGSARARISVADTGVGIPTEDIPRVFEPFERLGAEETEVEGTGLGLALSKRLTEAMGGEIGAESEIGRGTTFWLELPLVTAAPKVRTPDPGGPLPASRLRGPARTVLCIEDNPSNIKLVETIFADRPEVTLLVATQGSLGLELAREHRPALILLDVNLSDIPGEEVLRRLRSDARTADIAIVMVSADATPGQIRRLRRAGADDYLTKPFEIAQFLAIIDGAPPVRHAESTENGSANATAILDETAINRLHALARSPNAGSSAVRDIVRVFLSDALERVAALQAAVDDEDLDAAVDVAHALRSGSGAVGAANITSLCHRLEAAAELGDIETVRGAAEGLDAALADARDALEAEFGPLQADPPTT